VRCARRVWHKISAERPIPIGSRAICRSPLRRPTVAVDTIAQPVSFAFRKIGRTRRRRAFFSAGNEPAYLLAKAGKTEPPSRLVLSQTSAANFAKLPGAADALEAAISARAPGAAPAWSIICNRRTKQVADKIEAQAATRVERSTA
jgi:hypothetical protein